MKKESVISSTFSMPFLMLSMMSLMSAVAALTTLTSRLANSGFGHSGAPSPPFPSLPSLLPVPRGPTPKPARGRLGERCKLPQWVWGKTPADKRFGALSEPKGVALVATVFVHFHNNKFKFLYKHKTA